MADRNHAWLDKRSLALASAVADRLESNPELLAVARKNLDSWIGQSSSSPPSAHLEWRDILDHETVEAIVQLLRTDSERGQRLRQSNPFAGLLTPRERWSILSQYEARSA